MLELASILNGQRSQMTQKPIYLLTTAVKWLTKQMVNFKHCVSIRLCGQNQVPRAATLKYQTSHHIQSVKSTIALLQLLQRLQFPNPLFTRQVLTSDTIHEHT